MFEVLFCFVGGFGGFFVVLCFGLGSSFVLLSWYIYIYHGVSVDWCESRNEKE